MYFYHFAIQPSLLPTYIDCPCLSVVSLFWRVWSPELPARLCPPPSDNRRTRLPARPRPARQTLNHTSLLSHLPSRVGLPSQSEGGNICTRNLFTLPSGIADDVQSRLLLRFNFLQSAAEWLAQSLVWHGCLEPRRPIACARSKSMRVTWWPPTPSPYAISFCIGKVSNT